MYKTLLNLTLVLGFLAVNASAMADPGSLQAINCQDYPNDPTCDSQGYNLGSKQKTE